MKKITLYLLLFLAICTLLFAFSSCDLIWPKCTSHVDGDHDGMCDECGEEAPGDPDDDPTKDPGDIPEPEMPELPDLSGITFGSEQVVYNAEAHYITIEGDLPSGVTVRYTGNGQTNVGVYEVVASFYYAGEELTGAELRATLTVSRATVDTSNLAASISTASYNSGPHYPSLAGELPRDISVTYSYADADGEAVEAILSIGTYTVTATFVYDSINYNDISPVVFDYTVTRGTHDMSAFDLESLSKIYDGEAVDFSMLAIPDGVSANFTITNSLGNSVDQIINAGVYNVSTVFSGDFSNYYPIEDISATILVEKASLVGIVFEDAVFNYDGAEKSIFVSGAPSWMTVTYEGNGVLIPGFHTVTASFSENENYLPLAPMQATITINGGSILPTTGLVYEVYESGYAVSAAPDGVEVIVIPESYEGKPVLSIKSFAFEGNTAVTYVRIPSGVVNIGNRAFADCTSLESIEFGNIEVIGQEAFKNTALRSVSLPESLESIGFGAFENTRLERMTLPFVGGSRNSSNAYIGYIFGGSTYAANAAKVPDSLRSVVLDNGCTSVPSRAFFGVTSITEVVFGTTVAELGISAFQGCTSLREVYIPATMSDIPADTKAENGPFYGTASDMMIVVESMASAGKWGRYFAYIGEDRSAIVVYNKSYEDYLLNKDGYREADLSDATVSGVFVDGVLLQGFDSSVYTYTLDADINAALPKIVAVASEASATITVDQASASNERVATITVVSMNGENTLVYKVSFNLTGSFAPSAEVVNKDGAKGTVSFILDDGFQPTATFMRSIMEKYAKLSVTYAISTKTLVSTDIEYANDYGLIIDDIDGDGMMEYVLDENGNYTYVRNEEVIDFWKDILSVGRSEIVAHSHTHAFMGINDEGGAQLTASTADKIATRIYNSLVEGSFTKEVYASMQIVKDIFGYTSRGITYVNGGIPPKGGDTVVTAEVKVYLSKQTVRVLYDTAVTALDGKIYLKDLTWVNLQSTVGTLPADTDIVTTADISSGTIPAGTPIYLPSDYVTVPTTDPDGNANVVKGFKANLDDLYMQALEDGTFIGARTSGRVVYNASDFLDPENRILRRAYIITTSTNDARPTSWKDHIDDAIAADGGWASFCIHAITEDIAEEGQGGHKITWEQAEDLFKYACDKGDDLWIATQTDATLYYHQWSTSTVTAAYDEATESIRISLTDEEDDSVYDMPLTIKVSVPGTWSCATLGGETIDIRTDTDGIRYVYVNVSPETSVSLIGQ